MMSFGRLSREPSRKPDKMNLRKQIPTYKEEGGQAGHNFHVYVGKNSKTFVSGTLAPAIRPCRTAGVPVPTHSFLCRPVPVAGSLASGLHMPGGAAGVG